MARHIVARTTEIPPGGNKVVDVEGRDIVVFHVNGEFFALLNRCPHAGAPLDKAACVARLTSPEPGVYQRSRVGELLRCAWHGWEFDMRTGQSWFDPKRVKVRTYPVAVEDGEELGRRALCGRDLSGARRGQLRHRRDVTLCLSKLACRRPLVCARSTPGRVAAGSDDLQENEKANTQGKRGCQQVSYPCRRQ